MASERIFRDTLCESRSYAVETTDPTGARTIDEQRRLVKELRAALEGEKVKNRQLVRDHEKQLQHLREEEARRLDTSLEACSLRKDQEKTTELKKLEERLKKQKDQELRQLAKEKTEELNKSFRKWSAEKNEAIRAAVENERRLSLEDSHASFAEEEALAREGKLTREVFMLGEQNSVLEEQVRNLSRLNRAQIDQMRRIKQECDVKVDGILRQHKVEASREMAQLKLAEQIIAEKDHDLHAVSYRADMALLEKAELEEELATMKTNSSSFQDTPQHESTPTRRSLGGGGGGGGLQRRTEELTAQVKKLEEEKAGLKQDNASLRKKLLRDDGDEEKLKTLRKKNSELTTSNKDLEDRMRVLKAEHDQLRKVKSPAPAATAGDTNDSTFRKPGESDQNVRKALARQHAKDISEYTKQIHAKDREIGELKKKTIKLEATVLSHSEPSPELEKKVKSMAMEKLRMERLITKLYSRLPAAVSTEDLSQKDLESSALEQLTKENQALLSRVQALEEAASREEEATRETLQREKGDLLAENNRLKDLAQSASKLESECISLRRSQDDLEKKNSSLEQRCHELSQQLKISELAVRELEGSQGGSGNLENQVLELKGQLKEREGRVEALEKETKETSSQLSGKLAIIDLLQKRVESLEGSIREKEKLNTLLKTTLDSMQAEVKPSVQTADVGIQNHMTSPEDPVANAEPAAPRAALAKTRSDSPSKRFPKDRIRSPVRRGLRSHSPRTSSGDLMDSSLDNEMRAVGVDVNDSYDSSEGIGFSDTNVESSVLGSDHSLVIKEEGSDPSVKKLSPSSHKTAWTEDSSDQAQAKPSDDVSSRLSGPSVNGEGVSSAPGEGLGGVEVEEEVGGSGQGYDQEISADKGTESDESHTPQSDNFKVGVYIAKFSYNPSEMSPNQNFDLELPLTAGDYLYVYGDMDDDGYYHGQLMTGQSGMVPSNFIEKVTDDEDEDGSHTPNKLHKRGGSLLHDIEEVDEPSSGGTGSIPPPHALTLERQFVEGGMYTVALQWEVPRPLPEGATGYCVYVNGESHCDVEDATQTGVLVTEIPRKQLVKISVRTITEEGESPDPAKLVILNPQYPEPPSNVKVTRSVTPACLMVHWLPSKPLKEGNPIEGYTVYLNGHSCAQLGSNPTPVKSVCTQVFASDLRDFKDELLKADIVSLTACAMSKEYFSAHSLPIVVSKDDVQFVCAGGKMTTDESEITSSATSLSSIEDEEEKEVYGEEEEEVQPQEVGVVLVEDVGGSPEPPANGTEQEEERQNVPAAYYRAVACYDPQLQSPNEEGVEEELGFEDGDIIVGLEPIDEDGFIFADLNGKTGYVPSNLVDQITDEEELSRIDALLQEQLSQSQQRNMNGNQGSREEQRAQMKALFDYDPAQDSPNENSEIELAINEGDVVTVFGKPDGNGFFKAEVAGKKGLVPCNFLEDMTPPRNDGIEVFAADDDAMRIADSIIQKADIQPAPQAWKSEKGQKQRKGGLLSRGKNLLSKRKQRGGD